MNNIVKFSDNLMSDFQKLFNQAFLGDWELPSTKLTLQGTNFPPYNIYTQRIKLEDGTSNEHTFVEFALAGFKKDEIEVSLSNGVLKVSTNYMPEEAEETEEYMKYSPKYSHQGIAKRWFEWQRTISNNLEVVSAKYEDGILKIELANNKCDDYRKIPVE